MSDKKLKKYYSHSIPHMKILTLLINKLPQNREGAGGSKKC